MEQLERSGSVRTLAAWSVVLAWSRLAINAGLLLILARWLDPADLGAVGLAGALALALATPIATAVSDAVVRAGPFEARAALRLAVCLGLAGSVGLLVGFLLALGLFGPSALILYGIGLAPLPLITALGAVPEGLARAGLKLKRLALRTTLAQVSAAGLALWLGAHGWGGWALVIFTLTAAMMSTLLVTLLASGNKWPRHEPASPRLKADIRRIGLRNAAKSAAMPLLLALVIAMLGAASGGILYVALRLATLLSAALLMPAQSFALPLFAARSGGKDELVSALAAVSLVSAPAYLGVAAVAGPLLGLMLADMSEQAAPVLQALLLHSPALVVAHLCGAALTAAGRSDLMLRHSLMMLAGILVGIPLALQVSLTAAALAFGALNLALMAWIVSVAARELHLDKASLAGATLRPYAAALAMAFSLAALDAVWLYELAPLLRLGVLVPAGMLIYPLFLVVLARPLMVLSWRLLRNAS